MNQLAFNAEAMINAIEKDPQKLLAPLMNQSHTVLSHLGLSTGSIERIRKSFHQAGALASKITGAGCGGFVHGLFKKSTVQALLPGPSRIIV